MWKELMAELESLTEASGSNAHRVATIARQLLNDRQWLDGEHGGKLDEAEAELAKFSRRMALSLDSLLGMIEVFPDANDWDGADLEEMRWKAACELNRRQAARRAAQRVQQSTSDEQAAPWKPVKTPSVRSQAAVANETEEDDAEAAGLRYEDIAKGNGSAGGKQTEQDKDEIIRNLHKAIDRLNQKLQKATERNRALLAENKELRAKLAKASKRRTSKSGR